MLLLVQLAKDVASAMWTTRVPKPFDREKIKGLFSTAIRPRSQRATSEDFSVFLNDGLNSRKGTIGFVM